MARSVADFYGDQPAPLPVGVRRTRRAAEAGLTRYDHSYADVTALQPVDRAALLRQRGRLVPSEVERLATRLRTHLGL